MVATVIYIFRLSISVGFEDEIYDLYEDQDDSPPARSLRGRMLILILGISLMWIGAVVQIYFLILLEGTLTYEVGLLLVGLSLVMFYRDEDRALVKHLALGMAFAIILWATVIALAFIATLFRFMPLPLSL